MSAPSKKNDLTNDVHDLKTDTKGIISLLILAGVLIAAFLIFVGYYGVLWTPAKPWDMMR